MNLQYIKNNGFQKD